jgi:YjbE family integral membrane protein
VELISGLLNIVLINLVLSGDNAVVIGMAAHRLDPRQRRVAILIGGLAAIVLRIVLTVLASLLLEIPVLRLIGGALLVWIAFNLLECEEQAAGGAKVAHTLRGAIMTILVADLIMSTDNVLGVAAASHGDMALLSFGLVTSMAVLMFLGGLVAAVIDRFWWLAYLGSAVIAWTGATLALEDTAVEHLSGPVPAAIGLVTAAAVTLATLAFAHWFHRVRGAEPAPPEPARQSSTSAAAREGPPAPQ